MTFRWNLSLRQAATVGALALVANPALAQNTLLEANKGKSICFPQVQPSSAPGLYGNPTWPAAQAIAPSGQVRGDTGDPRWGNAPLTSFVYDGANDSHFGQFRVLFDSAANELVVAIQVNDDPNDANQQDTVHFGIAKDVTGTTTSPTAFGIEIPVYGKAGTTTVACTADSECLSGVCAAVVPPATTRFCANTERGRYVKPDLENVFFYTYQSGAWGSPAVQGSVIPAANVWVKDMAVWNQPSEIGDNGAAWVVQFRVMLSKVGIAATDRALVNMGANVKEDDGVFSAVIPHVIPNTSTGCNGTAGACNLASTPFFYDPRQWNRTAPIDGGCPNGIIVEPEDMGTLHPSGSEYVRTDAGLANVFEIRPDYNNVSVPAGVLRARLRIANWGSVADPQSGWYELAGGTDPLFATSASFYKNADIAPDGSSSDGGSSYLSYPCNNTGSGTNVCGLNLNTSIHQCIQVELSPAPLNNLNITRATAWKNTRFVPASEVIETATISVAGLQARLGNTNARDVYLHVVTTNMPTAGTVPMELDVDALESLREQTDPFFDAGAYCADRKDLCVPAENDSGGLCMFLAPNAVDCGAATPYLSADESTYICVRQEECTPVPGGGANPVLTSKSRSQVLTQHYPTMMVYPYYDSGRTQTIRGQTRRVLVPMYPFGLHITHAGEFYGWLHGLSGAGLEIIRPDFYHIRINNEQKVNIEVRASAEEQPHHDSFSQIAGTATILSWNLGFVNITGTADATLPVDLTKATVTVTKLLTEGNTERVTNLKGPRILKRQFGATASSASFASTGGNATVRMDVVDLPLLGRIITINTTGANVSQPASCGWFGSTHLTTEFTITDGIHTPVTVAGDDQWTCAPLTLLNY